MRDSEGFTLVELLIVIAIIAILAGLAIPSLISARLSANEAATIGTLRNISSAQAQFQASAKADVDMDGTGEFGGFRELSGCWDVRNNSEVGKILPPVLSAGFRESALGTAGGFERSGYIYRILLPTVEGLGICVDDIPTAFANVDADLAETTWCCYAWPGNYGNSGTRCFAITTTGDIFYTDDKRYTGKNPPDLDFAAAFKTTRSGSITGRVALGTTASDGNFWWQVN
jgi:prepilin-type N-terminal cleavage/methylation domain-containing protein